jgi:transposase
MLFIPLVEDACERLLAELGIEVWIGDAAKTKTKGARKQKTDRQDAQLLLKLLLENNFPRVWVPSPENRDLRQLLCILIGWCRCERGL